MNYHDAIARWGEGSAHPGGFSGTLELLRQFPIAAGKRVLEVGCGTGRTACHLARQGCEVTAVDIHSAMLEKARKRAALEGVRIHFKKGDACCLPVKNEAFDVVFVESVTIFTPAKRAVLEYYRVLSSGGRLYDREMLWLQSAANRNQVKPLMRFYGISRLLCAQDWLRLYRQANFHNVFMWNLQKSLPFLDGSDYDPLRQPDPYVLKDQRFHKLLQQNDALLSKFRKDFGFAVFIADKK